MIFWLDPRLSPDRTSRNLRTELDQFSVRGQREMEVLSPEMESPEMDDEWAIFERVQKWKSPEMEKYRNGKYRNGK